MAVFDTTYSTAYKSISRSPSDPRFHQYKSMEIGTFQPEVPMLQPREFPVQPAGCHRRTFVEVGPGLGLGTKTGATDVLVRPLAPQHAPLVPLKLPLDYAEAKIAKIPPEVRQQIMDAYRDRLVSQRNLVYTTTTDRQNREAAVVYQRPVPHPCTAEPNADQVRDRPRRYDTEAHEWQRVGGHWDRVQPRHSENRDPATTRTHHEAVLERRKKRALTPVKSRRALPDKLGVTFIRQIPRYGGFVPRDPIPEHMGRVSDDGSLSSWMRASYVPMHTPSSSSSSSTVNHHHGPLSKQVTLTYPYNPFNRVDNGQEPSYYIGL